VPLIFVSGDLAVTKEVEEFIPNIASVAVKEAVSRTAAKCINPQKARKLIKDGVMEALTKRESIHPFIFKPPIKVKIQYVESLMVDAISFIPIIERINGRTVSFVLDDYLQTFRLIRASIFIANGLST